MIFYQKLLWNIRSRLTLPHFEFLSLYLCMFDQNLHFLIWAPWFPLRILMGIESKTLMVHHWMPPKLPPIWAICPFMQAYIFISFQEIFPPILLFSPIFLLVFQKVYFYSELSSILNSRLQTFYFIFYRMWLWSRWNWSRISRLWYVHWWIWRHLCWPMSLQRKCRWR